MASSQSSDNKSFIEIANRLFSSKEEELIPILQEYYNQKEKIEEIILKKPQLAPNEIKDIISNIDFYQLDSDKEESTNSYFQDILEIYDDTLSIEDRWKCLLWITIPSYFETYAKKHYKEFQDFLKDKIFAVNNDSNFFESLEEFQMMLDFTNKEDQLHVRWINFSPKTTSILYRLFVKNLRFLEDNSLCIKNYCNEMLEGLSLSEMLSFIISQKHSFPVSDKEFKLFLSFLSHKLTAENRDVLESSSLIETKEDFQQMINYLSDIIPSKVIEDFDFFGYFYNVVLRNKARSFPREENNFSNMYSLSYLQALNDLEKTSHSSNYQNPLYLRCFQIFIQEFLKEFEDTLEKEDFIILEILFRRIICHKNIRTILNIKNRLMLWHYYKTEEFVNPTKYTIEEIKKYNAKNYLKLIREYNEKEKEKTSLNYDSNPLNSTYYLDEQFYCEKHLDFIRLLNSFEYDDVNKMLLTVPYQLSILANFSKDKDPTYLKKFRDVLIPNLSYFQTNKDKLESFLVCHQLLVEQEEKATFTKTLHCIDSLTCALLPNNMCLQEELEKLNLVAKGDPLKEKIEGIKLYNEYRLRLKSTIPEVLVRSNKIYGKMIDMHDKEIISNGIGKYVLPNKYASSCLTPAGKASSCLKHGAMNENGRFFGVYYQDKIIAYSWVWRRGDVLAFDNIEVTKELLQIPNYQEVIFDIYRKASLEIMEKTKQEQRGGIKLVILGRNPIDVPNLAIDSLPNIKNYTTELLKPTGAENLYMKDSASKQVILAGNYQENINLEDVDASYLYPRKDVKKFKAPLNSVEKQTLRAIQFDDAIRTNRKYQGNSLNYKEGFYNEDWFVGYLEDGSHKFFYRDNDKRLFQEAKDYVRNFEPNPKPNIEIIQPNKQWVERILDRKNILVDHDKLYRYLQRTDREDFPISSQHYYHKTRGIFNFQRILADRAITSANYGKHSGGQGCNGKYFISVARYGSELFTELFDSMGFFLNPDLCSFAVTSIKEFSQYDFSKSSYPFRSGLSEDEEQVFREIKLDDKAKAISVSNNDLIELSQILYLTELYGFNLPLIDTEIQKVVDRNYIKKYIKIKK